MATADLSKQLEKGHRRYSCLIYTFPPGSSGAEGHIQRDGVTFVPTAQLLSLLLLPPLPRARPVPCWVHELQELWSHEPTLPSCDYSQASNLSPLPAHQRGRGLVSRKAPNSDTHVKCIIYLLNFPRARSCWMTVGFSRFPQQSRRHSGQFLLRGNSPDLRFAPRFARGIQLRVWQCPALSLPLPEAAALQTQPGLPAGARWTRTQASDILGMYTGSSARLSSQKGWRNLALPSCPHPSLPLTKAKPALQWIPACSIPRQGPARK